jgi:hypothetical protein
LSLREAVTSLERRMDARFDAMDSRIERLDDGREQFVNNVLPNRG